MPLGVAPWFTSCAFIDDPKSMETSRHVSNTHRLPSGSIEFFELLNFPFHISSNDFSDERKSTTNSRVEKFRFFDQNFDV